MFFFVFFYFLREYKQNERRSLCSPNSRPVLPVLVSPFQASIIRSYFNDLCSASLNARLSFYMHVIV